MRRAFTIMCLMLCAAWWQAQVAQAQGGPRRKPPLSGTWALDKSRSKLTAANPVMKGATLTLTVSHTEPEIKMVQKTNRGGEEKTKEFLYYTDGRGESNPASNLYLSFYNGNENDSPSPRRIESKSIWKGDKLQTTYQISVRIPDGGRVSIAVVEEWSVSSDGQTLTHTTSFSPDDDYYEIKIEPRKLKRVFTKIS